MKADKLDVYKHFKGVLFVKLYEAEHSETGETMIVYVSTQDGKIWTSPKNIFEGKVDQDRFVGPRFFQVNGD